MSMLSQIKSGVQKKAYIYTCYGPNGVGKSTFGSHFPSPVFADLERGSFHLDVPRNDKIETLEDFRKFVSELGSEEHKFKTLVVDSVEALEVLILNHIKNKYKVESIEDISYGKGYSEAREIMQDLMRTFRALADSKNITIVLIGHSQVKAHTDPSSHETYDRYIMRCSDKMAAVIKDLSDNVFFITHKVYTSDVKGKTKAFSDGSRIMYTQWRSAWDAKTRLDLPLELPLSYEALEDALGVRNSTRTDELYNEVLELTEGLESNVKSKVLKFIEENKTNVAKLKETKNRIITLKEKQ